MASLVRSINIVLATLIPILGSNACSAQDSTPSSQKTISLDGVLNEINVNNAISAINGDKKIVKIRIRSGGGWPEPSARLAAVIQARRLAVEVDDFCLSACMSFIFMASPTRTVENGSILGFHYADSYDVAYLSPRFGTEGVNVQSRVDGPVRNVYRAAGISEDLLIHQGTMLEPICWTEMSRDRSNKSLVYRYGIWMPTTANMKAWNIDFTGAPLADILPNGPLNESGQKLIAMKLGETKPGVLPAVVIGGPNKSASSSTRDKIDRCGPNLVTKVVH